MTSAFSFIIQNDFLYKVKNNNMGIKWPLNFKSTGFTTIQKITEYIQNTHRNDGSIIQHEHYSRFYQYIYGNDLCCQMNTKYKLFNSFLTNMFLDNKLRNELIDLFTKYQKVYFGFSKLALLYKIKKATRNICYDLCMNELSKGSKNVLEVLIDGHVYMYSLTDIVNIFTTSLTSMNYMVTLPCEVKNPYTNKPFTLNMLYTMYFFIRRRLCSVPILLECFFRTGFNLNKFTMIHEIQIQDYALDCYVKNTPYMYLLNGLYDMIAEYSEYNVDVNIHPEFPERDLCQIMKPYLLYYYKGKYSKSSELADHYSKLLRGRLHDFFIFNPKFGTVQRVDDTGNFIFDTTHISLNQHRISNDLYAFNKRHLEISSVETNERQQYSIINRPVSNTYFRSSFNVDVDTESTESASLASDT